MAKKPKNTSGPLLGPSQNEREYAALPQPEETLPPNEKGEREVGKLVKDASGSGSKFYPKPKSTERYLDEGFGRAEDIIEKVAKQAKPKGTQAGHHVTNTKNHTKKVK